MASPKTKLEVRNPNEGSPVSIRISDFRFRDQPGIGGGTSAKRSWSSATVSAAAQLAIPFCQTSDLRVILPAFTWAASAVMSNGPADAPSMAAWNAAALGTGGGAPAAAAWPGETVPGAVIAPPSAPP